MSERVVVDVEWDPEAAVWLAACGSMGLFTEADTLDELRRRIPLIASDLLSGDSSRAVDLHIELIVRFDETVRSAA